MNHYQEYNLDIYVSRWQKALEYPANHPESFHPALLNAIYFSACSLRGASNYSDYFQRIAREEMRSSLSLCDRVEHWLYASIILASELCRTGSPAAIMNCCAEMISIAFACNLHKFTDAPGYQTFDWGLMSTPRSPVHAAERINLWWTVFVLERSASIALSVPGSIPLEACMVSRFFWILGSSFAESYSLFSDHHHILPSSVGRGCPIRLERPTGLEPLQVLQNQ